MLPPPATALAEMAQRTDTADLQFRDLRNAPPLLSYMQCAAMIGVTERTIKRWVASKTNRLPRYRLGNRARVLRDDLLRLLGVDV